MQRIVRSSRGLSRVAAPPMFLGGVSDSDEPATPPVPVGCTGSVVSIPAGRHSRWKCAALACTGTLEPSAAIGHRGEKRDCRMSLGRRLFGQGMRARRDRESRLRGSGWPAQSDLATGWDCSSTARPAPMLVRPTRQLRRRAASRGAHEEGGEFSAVLSRVLAGGYDQRCSRTDFSCSKHARRIAIAIEIFGAAVERAET